MTFEVGAQCARGLGKHGHTLAIILSSAKILKVTLPCNVLNIFSTHRFAILERIIYGLYVCVYGIRICLSVCVCVCFGA